jgi:hypothetical protein
VVALPGQGQALPLQKAASLVLLDDNFASIVRAVRLGRRIFDNLRKAMSFIVSVHIPIAGMSLLPVLLNWPLVLLPVHVVFLELIIDPACPFRSPDDVSQPAAEPMRAGCHPACGRLGQICSRGGGGPRCQLSHPGLGQPGSHFFQPVRVGLVYSTSMRSPGRWWPWR